MPKNKNAEYRFMVLDRCFSDFHHKYSIEDLLEKVNDKLYDANGSKSMIMVRQLRGDFNAIRKMLPDAYTLKLFRMMARSVTIVIPNQIFLSTETNCL